MLGRPGDKFCVRDMDWLASIRDAAAEDAMVEAIVVTGLTSGGGVEWGLAVLRAELAELLRPELAVHVPPLK